MQQINGRATIADNTVYICIVECNPTVSNANKFIVGEYEFNSITAPELHVLSRLPEYSMTNDPEKVWPGGVVHYVMDTSLGKWMITYTHVYIHLILNRCCTKHLIREADTNSHINNVLQFIIF